jgi:hypothetical protein
VASGALEAEDRKPAYIELSEIVRVYLGRRYEFPALDSTSSEIRAYLRRRAGTEAALEILDDWLRVSDMVKYAGYQPPEEEARAAVAEARELIAATPAAIATQLAAVMPDPVAPAPVVEPAAAPVVEPAAAPVAETVAEPEPDAGDTLRGVVAVTESREAPEGPDA